MKSPSSCKERYRGTAIAAHCTSLLATLAILACAAASVVSAQSPSPLSIPNLQLHQNGSVLASVTLADGSVIVGGTFSSLNGVPRSNIAKFQSAGTLDPTWAPDVSGSPAAVQAIAVDGSNGDIYIGGFFSAVNGVPRANLARLHADGSLDPTWDPSVDVGFNPLNELGLGVFALALDGAGNLFVGGSFTGIGGTVAFDLAKVSTSGAGAIDPTWNVVPSDQVNALAFDGTSLFVGGYFTDITAGGVDFPRLILAKVSPTGVGAVDATWQPQPDASIAYGIGPSDQVSALALDGSGNLYVGGSFFTIGGEPGGKPFPHNPIIPPTGPGIWCSGLAKLSTSGTGAPDQTWNASQTEAFADVAPVANVLVLDGMGHLYAGGPANAYRKSTSGTGATDVTWLPSFDSTVNTLALAHGGGVYAGGRFLNAGGVRHFGLAKVGTTGVVSLSTPDAETRGQVYALAPLADGSMIVGGNFLKSGQQARKNILRMKADGTLDTTWNPGADQTVMSLAADGAGSVYAGGAFANIGGQVRASVAKLSATGTGTVDSTWNPSVGPAGSFVYAFALDGSNVYIAGNFTQVGAQAYNGGLARVSATGAGAVDTGWIPFATDVDNDFGNVNALALDGGYLYAGGGFFDGAGGTLGLVARYSTAGNGSPDTSWNPAPNVVLFGNNQINAIYADGAGSLFIGGTFQGVGALTRNNIAKVSTSGAGDADANWDPSADEQVLTLLPDGNGNLYAGGGFFNIGGQARRCIAKLSATGTGAADATWNASADDVVRVLVPGSVNGDIYMGGDFVGTGTEAKFGLAAFAADVVFSNGFEGTIAP